MKETDEYLKGLLEAALFAAGRPLSTRELADLAGSGEDRVRLLMEALAQEYSSKGGGLEIRAYEDRYAMQVRPDLAPGVTRLAPKELEAPLLRTLAVIAYRQPITQSEVVRLRGNKAYEHVRELDRLGLVSAVKAGRSKLLSTTRGFADYFGLASENPEVVRQMLGDRRKPVGVTPMFESLARRLNLDYLVVNPYRPEEDDRERLHQIRLLVASPGYMESIRAIYSGQLIEARSRTLSQLKESIESLVRVLDQPVNPEPLLEEIDVLLQEYRRRGTSAAAVKPLTSMIRDLAEDLHVSMSEAGVTAAPSHASLEAQIQVPSHQDYSLDIVDRIRQRCEILLAGLGA